MIYERCACASCEDQPGPLYDIGIYCINASRYLFRAEPEEVFAYAC
jgi:predicted dehydrogenase